MTQTGTTSVQVICNTILHIFSLSAAQPMVLAMGMWYGQASSKQ